jgi:hypothetical protein
MALVTSPGKVREKITLHGCGQGPPTVQPTMHLSTVVRRNAGPSKKKATTPSVPTQLGDTSQPESRAHNPSRSKEPQT